MITGQGITSLRIKSLENQKTLATGFQKLFAATKASTGATGINLTALVTPPEMASTGFVNPTGSQLANANLLFFQNNLTLVSSARGLLQKNVSYVVASSTQINFLGFTALEGEIFTLTIDYSAQTGVKVVDATATPATGTLPAGTTDFNVGQVFQTNKYSTTQVGACLVYLDGVLQFRNPNNSSSTLTGNYYEVDNGGGSFTLIRFNQADPDTVRNVLVIPNGLLSERPDGSMMAVIESLQGQVNSMAAYVASLAGLTQTNILGSAPTNVDLKAFGDRVLAAETNITTNNTTLSARDNALESPTSQTDIIATRLGQKVYSHGGSYNGGAAPTLALTAGGGTLNTVSIADFIPYQTQDGNWRLRFNVAAILSSATRTNAQFSIVGLSFYTTGGGGDGQYVGGQTVVAGANTGYSYAGSNTNVLNITHGSSATTEYWFSGDVKLNSKPTWAY